MQLEKHNYEENHWGKLCDVTPNKPNIKPRYTFKPKSIKRPNNKGHAQDGPNPHGLLILFTWAKEDVKI